jgi:hypothetical protein
MPRRRPRSICELRSRATDYLDEFTDPSGSYAFVTYDQAPTHDGPLTAADILMANLLSLRLGWRDVIPLFAEADTPETALRRALDAALDEARSLPALEDCDDFQVKMPALASANKATELAFQERKPKRWTPVTVSKVLHRLARNVPLIDSEVRKFYQLRWASDIRRELRDDIQRNRIWLNMTAARYPIHGAPMPLTRVTDILIWMDKGHMQGTRAPETTCVGEES